MFGHHHRQFHPDEEGPGRWSMGGRGRHGHRGRGGDEGNPFGGNPFGGNPFDFGRGGFPRRFPFDFFQGARARRGDIRAAILALLAEQPRNGYQLMQEVEQRSRGLWRPSPGSVYPALQQLQDEGLVREEAGGSGRTFQLTEAGQAHVKAHPDEVRAPWDSVGGPAGEQLAELWQLIAQVASATKQVARSGSGAQVAEAKKVLAEARRALYRLLAEDPDEER